MSYSLFSFKQKSMRFFNWRRLFMASILLPVFTILLIFNRSFMLLDYIFFPHFLSKKILRPIFIVAIPRSATTFLFQKLTNLKNQHTSFKLWEIIFAPSIIQKYFCIGLISIDKSIGGPFKLILGKIENKLLRNIKSIHDIGLALPEEDEAILLWNLSTIYLNFFFPDSHLFDKYFEFDEALSVTKKKRVMRYYYRCIQRHNFVFNSKNKKFFLSKNPALMSKINSLHSCFPDAQIININRNPAYSIPSTLALNDAIYSIFTSIKQSSEIKKRTSDILIKWYQMAHESLRQKYPTTIYIDFKKLVNNDAMAIANLCLAINIDPMVFTNANAMGKSSNSYEILSEDDLSEVLVKIPFMSSYC